MKILALDQALVTSGYAVFDNSKLIAADTFTVSKTQSMDKRLLEIYTNLSNLFYEYEFDRVCFEDIQLQAGNALTYKHLAYTQAAIILWCGHMMISYEILAPSHWRKVLGGGFGRKRQEQKEHAIALAKEWYGKDVSSDVADAICLGRAAVQERQEKKVAFNEEAS